MKSDQIITLKRLCTCPGWGLRVVKGGAVGRGEGGGWGVGEVGGGEERGVDRL